MHTWISHLQGDVDCNMTIGEIYQNYQPLIDAYFSLLTMYIYLGEFQAMTEILLVLMLWLICYRNRHLSKVQNMQRSTCDELMPTAYVTMPSVAFSFTNTLATAVV